MADERRKFGTSTGSEELLSCATCAKVIDFFNVGKNGDEVSLGPFSSLMNAECPHSDWIKHYYINAFRNPRFSKSTVYMSKSGSSIYLPVSHDGEVWYGRNFEHVWRKDTRRSNPGGYGRILDPNWIDEEVILHWKDLCQEDHGLECERPSRLQRIAAIQPMWLIDTIDACLVPSHAEMRYIALSYIRRQTTPFCNEKAILEQLQQPGVLTTGAIAEQLPRIIRNAIDITPLLKERYLWVDLLCIVRDDMEIMQAELNAMARIYWSSYFTIVAMDGTDTSYGLRGFKGLTPPRDIKQEIIPLAAPEKLLIPMTRDPKHSEAYHSQAWTYQEYLCARRRLIFENGTVHWECSSSHWSEDLFHNPTTYPSTDYKYAESENFPQLFSKRCYPDLMNMNYLLADFNEKILPSPDDALLAFSGIQWILSQIFSGGLLYGIPELFFESGLMWNPIKVAERRHSTKRPLSESRLPSWSYLGWQGGMRFGDDSEFRALWGTMSKHTKGVYRPVTTWYTMNNPTSSEKRRIESNWYHYKSLAQDLTRVPPQGWRKQEVGTRWSYPVVSHTVAWPGVGREYVWTHSKLMPPFDPHEDRVAYMYPVPVLDPPSHYPPTSSVPAPDPTLEHPLQPQTQFLSCTTSRAFLHTGAVFPGDEPDGFRPRGDGFPKKVALQDLEGSAVGFLTLMQSGDVEEVAAMTAAGAPLELVAISEGWFGDDPRDEEEKTFHSKHRTFPRRDCYHVLWVEWEGGTAYRRGNGCVLKDRWETLREKDLVDLVLG